MRHVRMISLLTVLALALAAPATVLQGAATTFTVTKTADTADGTCDADCSLREAITAANANTGTDTIAFAIPGGGPHTIQPTSALPTITDPVIIDGYTQPGASENTNSVGQGLNTVLKIELDGTNAGGKGGGSGLHLTAGSSTVKGLVINRFSEHGIFVETNGANTIEGNFVGTDITGTVDLGNSLAGVFVLNAPGNTIGGATPGAGNVISGNDDAGVFVQQSGATGNVVQGNFIGTDVTGTVGLGNSNTGVLIIDSPNNTIGGTTAGARNIISSNGFSGVALGGSLAIGNLVQGNLIGTDISGTIDLGNSAMGVFIDGASSNSVGGTASGAGNTIAFNGADGVFVPSGTSNAIRSNSIYSNVGLGIDLDSNGVTPNDAGDSDAGPNNLQNFPVLTSAVTGGNPIVIGGTLDSAASTDFRVEFFANSACDPSGNGEGETFLGAATATTDAGGSAAFSVLLTKAVSLGAAITATATDPNNNTSEFSACVTAGPAAPVPGITLQALAGLAALLTGAFAWTVRRRQGAIAA